LNSISGIKATYVHCKLTKGWKYERDRQKKRQTNRWTDWRIRRERKRERATGRLTDRVMEKEINGQRDRWMDGQTNRDRAKQTDRRMDWRMDWLTDTRAVGWIDIGREKGEKDRDI
jgi:hypothetical protein